MSINGKEILVRHAKDVRIPKGAILLNEKEALRHQHNILSQWKNKKDLYPINYGFVASGVFGGLGGMFLTNFYRRKLKLRNYGLVTSHVCSIFFSGLVTAFCHSHFITDDILLQKTPRLMYIDFRSSVLQVVFGFCYPWIMTSALCFSYANLFKTYPVPNAWRASRELFQLWKKITQPALKKFAVVMCVQSILAVGIARMESRSIRYVTHEMSKDADNIRTHFNESNCRTAY